MQRCCNSSKAKKFYVVWQGRQPGVFETWEACKTQIDHFPEALYKSFPTKESAEEAFLQSPYKFFGKKDASSELTPAELAKIGSPIPNSISVDGAWNTANGKVEYQGVYTATKQACFHVGPLEDGTNNIAEFLAIVHALAYCQKHRLDCPVYSDSRNAIAWVHDKQARTNHPRSERNKPLFDLVDRALLWLKTHTYSNKILKWETKAWGENPADFGRK
jgi:ribonuclease HI